MLLLHYILLLYIIKNCLCDILFCVMVYLFLLVSCFSPFLTPTPSAAPQRHGGTGPSAADDAGRGGQLSRRHPPPGAAAGGGQGIAKAGGHPPPKVEQQGNTNAVFFCIFALLHIFFILATFAFWCGFFLREKSMLFPFSFFLCRVFSTALWGLGVFYFSNIYVSWRFFLSV